MLHYLVEECDNDVAYPKGALFIQDGMALFHALKGLAPTFWSNMLSNSGYDG